MADSAIKSTETGSRNLSVVVACGAVLLGTMWVVGQSGLEGSNPMKFAANVAVVLEALPVLAVVWLGAAGYGYPLRRVLLRDVRFGPVVQPGVGMAALMGVNWLLAWGGMLNMASAWGLCAAGVALLMVQVARTCRGRSVVGERKAIALSWLWPMAMLGPGVMLVAAACPPGTLWRVEALGYDVLSYHLQLPREWLDAGAMRGLEHNVYSFLPSLVEAAYMMLGAMRGSMHEAIYTAQLFHVTLAGLAVTAAGCAGARLAGATAGIVAGAAMATLPWMIVTGSLAYNEMAVLAFGAVAVLVMLDASTRDSWRGAAVVGALLGFATLAKLTAGLMFAVPLGVIALLGWHREWAGPTQWRENARRNVGFAAMMALTGTLMLAPYLARNAAWTGNPVFPFATSMLGTGHWDDDQANRWHEGHSPAWGETTRAGAVLRQWLLNTGYGGLGGYRTERRVEDLARFDREGGLPLWWLAVAAGAAAGLRRRGTRYVAAAMLGLVALQLVAWLGATHLQSRFLLPTLVPATLLLGLGLGRMHALSGARWPWVTPTAGAALVLTLAISSGVVLHRQTVPVTGADGMARPAAPALVMDSLAEPDGRTPGWVGDHSINALAVDTLTYLVADNQSLLYVRRPFVYHTPFDRSPMGEMIRRARGGEPGDERSEANAPGRAPMEVDKVNRLLRERGVTHVWIHWGELDRLHGTYGYDPDVTRAALERLIASGWRSVRRHGEIAALYALPELP